MREGKRGGVSLEWVARALEDTGSHLLDQGPVAEPIETQKSFSMFHVKFLFALFVLWLGPKKARKSST